MTLYDDTIMLYITQYCSTRYIGIAIVHMDGIGMPSKCRLHTQYSITTSPTSYNRWLGKVECRVESSGGVPTE